MATESQAHARSKVRPDSLEGPFTLAWLRPSGGPGPVFCRCIRAAGGALWLGVVAWSGPVEAAEPEIPALALSWLGAPGCPDRSSVLGRVRALLGPSPPPAEPIAAAGVVTASPGGYTLAFEVTQRGQTRQRALTAATCEEVSEAGALIVALAVNPALVVPARTDDQAPPEPTPDDAATGLADPPPLPPPPPEPKPPVALPAPPATRPRNEPQAQPFRLRRAFAAALGDVGSLPRVAAGARAGFELAREPFGLDFLADFLPPVRHSIAQGPERGGDLMLLAGGLRGCFVPFATPVELAACAGFEAGVVAAESFGANVSNEGGSAGWVAGRAGVGARVPLGGAFALTLDLEGLVPASRPRFVMTGLGRVHEPSAVVGRLGLGVEVSFFRRKR